MNRVLFCLIMVVFAGCDASTDPASIDREDTVVFEIEYVNYAWVPTWKGYYIDAGGSVWSYDRSDVRDSYPPTKTEYTHSELMEKLSAKRAHVRDLAITDVLTQFELIAGAADGALSPARGQCADAGVLTFRAYTYDSTRQRFTPVLLHEEGDRAQKNLSEEGQQLFAWLDALQLVQRFRDSCQP